MPQELVDLHIKLLRKARKSVSSERWERAIIKLCHGFCSQDAWEIERFGYKKARLSSKLRILKVCIKHNANEKLNSTILIMFCRNFLKCSLIIMPSLRMK